VRGLPRNCCSGKDMAGEHKHAGRWQLLPASLRSPACVRAGMRPSSGPLGDLPPSDSTEGLLDAEAVAAWRESGAEPPKAPQPGGPKPTKQAATAVEGGSWAQRKSCSRSRQVRPHQLLCLSVPVGMPQNMICLMREHRETHMFLQTLPVYCAAVGDVFRKRLLLISSTLAMIGDIQDPQPVYIR
jgi:hypothetical protein